MTNLPNKAPEQRGIGSFLPFRSRWPRVAQLKCLGKTNNAMSDHDPFNDPELAHPRSRELMPEAFLWDCANEDAPFGSDEGWTAYYEWRQWHKDNPASPLVDCFSWFLDGRLSEYNETICTDDRIAADLQEPDDAFMSEAFDMFTLDTTVIGTALGQLIDEGAIDPSAKPYVHVAIGRQLSPLICQGDERRQILIATKKVIDAA